MFPRQMTRRNSTKLSLLMSELCSFVFKALFTVFAMRMRKKVVMLIRIRHTCVALKHKKPVLSLETSSICKICLKKGKMSPFDKNE